MPSTPLERGTDPLKRGTECNGFVISAGLHVALIEPEIPQNTGNIGRTCVATGTTLHLVKPLGYVLDDTRLKRAGLDYWPNLAWQVHDGTWEFFAASPGRRFVLTASRGGTSIYDHAFEEGDVLVFGCESVGLADEVFRRVAAPCVTIPMVGPTRSLNIANSVAIVLFEALRQLHQRGRPVFHGAPISSIGNRRDEGRRKEAPDAINANRG